MAAKNKEKPEKSIVVAKNAAELQKIRLEKLMSNPAKPVHIPDRPKEYKPREPLEFIRNIWGSSAGAGSGDFHVYRGVRRREYARQKFRKERDEKEEADAVYHQKVEENQIAAEERTAKKRAKRLKKKQKQKNKKPRKETQDRSDDDDEEEDDDDRGGDDKNDGDSDEQCDDKRSDNTKTCNGSDRTVNNGETCVSRTNYGDGKQEGGRSESEDNEVDDVKEER